MVRLLYAGRMVLLFMSLCFIVNGYAQDYTIEKITTKEGLSQNDINCVFQSRDGFLWIGTNDGLNRFDGYSFKTYRYAPSNPSGLSSNLIFAISEDQYGHLWLGTSDEGVCRFDVENEKFTVFKNTDKTPNLLPSNQVICINACKDGTLWVGTSHGISVFEFIDDRLSVKLISQENTPQLNSDKISAIVEDQYGRKWVGTQQGVYVFAAGKDIKIQNKFRIFSPVNDIIFKDNDVYVAMYAAIYKYFVTPDNPQDIQTTKVSDINARSIILNRNGDLFTGNNTGLFVLGKGSFGKDTFKEPIHYQEGWEKNSLSKNIISCLYEDKSGIVWIGTNGGGLNKYNPKQKMFFHYNKTRKAGSLSNNKIRAIFEDRHKNIWIGTEGGGINFLPFSEERNFSSGFEAIEVNAGGNQNNVYSFVDLNKTGELMIVAGSGYNDVVSTYQLKNGHPQLVDNILDQTIANSPFTMLNDRNGNIWIGTYGSNGLYLYRRGEGREEVVNFVPDESPGSISSYNIRSLLEDRHGNIWVGTDSGLNLITVEEQKKDKPRFVVFTKDNADKNSISHNYVLPLLETKNGDLWVGTMGGGLNKLNYHLNPDSITFEAITTRDGLPSDVIKGILEDDLGFLWIASNKGLTKFDVKDRLFNNYDISDGLQDYEFGELACCKLRNGYMLFGGVNGFNVFKPSEILSDLSVPDVALTGLQILNQEVTVGDTIHGRVILDKVINKTEKITLKYSENSFAIYFSSLHFSSPGKNKYLYKLDGFEKEWIRTNSEERIAKYTNLNPGEYTFMVLGSNSDGVWTNNPKKILIEIIPPWWMSNLALFAYGLLFVLAVWFFQRYSLIRIRQKNELLMEHFEKEKIEELSQMKLKFFTNISHEFRTPLTLIIGPLEKLIKNHKNFSEEKIKENYSIMHRNASLMLRLINQLIDFRKFEQGKMNLVASEADVVSFIYRIFRSFDGMAETKSIQYQFVNKKERIYCWYDSDKLEKIMYNLLSNAFKFTRKGGQIDLEIDEDDSHVIIKVIDNGIGIPKEMQEHIFERFYQAKRVNTKLAGSTGIGLSLVKDLVALHEGEITFESEENQGTVFKVMLKKGNEHLDADKLNMSEEVIIQDEDSDADSMPVPVPLNNEDDSSEDDKNADKTKPVLLVVEDNIELSQFIKSSLSEKYKVYTAENGDEGLKMVHELNPNVVVSDVKMPVMSGFELCEAIKSDEKVSHTIVILLTAKTAPKSRAKGYSLGADGYISKPFSMDVLEARIDNLIESRAKLKERFRSTITIEPSEVTTTSMDEKFLKRILSIVEQNLTNPDFTIEQLAQDYGMTQVLLTKKLKMLTGQTTIAFVRSIRLKRAAQLLAKGMYSVADVTYEVGFSDLKYFRNCFKDEFGMSPSEYIKKNKEETT